MQRRIMLKLGAEKERRSGNYAREELKNKNEMLRRVRKRRKKNERKKNTLNEEELIEERGRGRGETEKNNKIW